MEENENTITNDITDESTPETEEKEPFTEKQLTQLLKQVREMMEILKMTWEGNKSELSLKDSHMMELCKYNEEH